MKQLGGGRARPTAELEHVGVLAEPRQDLTKEPRAALGWVLRNPSRERRSKLIVAICHHTFRIDGRLHAR
jgi:hypothetical protein